MRSLQLAVVVLLAVGEPFLFADQLAFKNGDRLSGTIVKSDTKTLIIKTTVAGEVAVQWQQVQKLRADKPLHVELADKGVLAMSMKARESGVEIVTNTGRTLETSKESVVALRNDAEQAAYEKSRKTSMLHRWGGNLDAGIEMTRGNSYTRNFRLGFLAERKVSRDRLTLYASSFRSFDDLPIALPHTTANLSRGGARLERDYGSRRFVFGNTDFMSDALQDLNLRSVLGGGLGFHLIQGDRTSLDVLGGVNFTHEAYVEMRRSLLAGQVGEEFKFKLGKNTSFVQNLGYFPDLTVPGDNYRVNFSFTSVTKVSRWFGWQNYVSNMYVSDPAAGKKKNEFLFTSGLQIAFSH